MYLQSSWLQQFSVPVELVELRDSPSSQENLQHLFNADVPIVVLNPVSTLSAFSTPTPTPSPSPFQATHTILAVCSPSPLAATKDASRMTAHAEGGPRTIFIDPARATNGLDILASDPSASLSVQRYQDEVTGSNISAVTRAITKALSSVGPISTEGESSRPSAKVLAIYTRTGRSLIKDALSTCLAVLRRADCEADGVLDTTSSLRERIEETKAKVLLEVFGGDEISKALRSARQDVKAVFDTYPGYKLLVRVDDVREHVTAAVRSSLGRTLEHNVRPASLNDHTFLIHMMAASSSYSMLGD